MGRSDVKDGDIERNIGGLASIETKILGQVLRNSRSSKGGE